MVKLCDAILWSSSPHGFAKEKKKAPVFNFLLEPDEGE